MNEAEDVGGRSESGDRAINPARTPADGLGLVDHEMWRPQQVRVQGSHDVQHAALPRRPWAISTLPFNHMAIPEGLWIKK